jgi:hypothetical protein
MGHDKLPSRSALLATRGMPLCTSRANTSCRERLCRPGDDRAFPGLRTSGLRRPCGARNHPFASLRELRTHGTLSPGIPPGPPTSIREHMPLAPPRPTAKGHRYQAVCLSRKVYGNPAAQVKHRCPSALGITRGLRPFGHNRLPRMSQSVEMLCDRATTRTAHGITEQYRGHGGNVALHGGHTTNSTLHGGTQRNKARQ